MKAPPDATGSRNVLFGYAERKRVSRHLAVVSVGPETAYSNSSSSKLNSTKTNQSNSRRVFHQQQLEKKNMDSLLQTDERSVPVTYAHVRRFLIVCRFYRKSSIGFRSRLWLKLFLLPCVWFTVPFPCNTAAWKGHSAEGENIKRRRAHTCRLLWVTG